MKTIKRFLPLLLIMTIAACTAAPAPVDQVGTVVAATVQAMTQQALLNPPTATSTQAPSPTTAPTNTPVPPVIVVVQGIRLNFSTGATFGTSSITLSPGQTATYILACGNGQPMMVSVDSAAHDGTFSLSGANGVVLVPESAHQATWQGLLPATQDYYIKVIAGASGGNYILGVTVASRIQFASGATSATLTGTTVNGYTVSYVARASAGQTMTIHLTPSPAGNAALTIWGLTDGNPYQRAVSGSPDFNMVLPSTQDYIIDVVPMAGMVVNYSMTVEIH
jgi:hypothetical protein